MQQSGRIIKLKPDPSPKQAQAWLKFFDPITTELGYGGGARGGKSWFGIESLVVAAHIWPDTRWLIGRNSLKTLKQTSLPSFYKVARFHGLEKNRDYTYNGELDTVDFTNGSQILLKDLKFKPNDDPLYTRIGGLEITGALIEESNEVPGIARNTVKSRCGNWNNAKYGIKPILIETFNPSKGHVYQNYWKPYKEGKMPSHRCFIRALAQDNIKDPNIEKYILELERNPDKILRERLLYGNFDYDDDPLKIFIYDKLNDLFHNTHVLPGEMFMTIDPAGRGKDKTVIMIWSGLQVIYIYSEETTDQKELYEKIRGYQNRYQVPNSNTIVDYDGLGVGIGDFLKCVRFQGGASAFQSEEEEENEYKLKVRYKNLRSQCYFAAAEKTNDNAIYIKIDNAELQNIIVEELDVIREVNDGKEGPKQIIAKGSQKEDPGKQSIRGLLGRSPDYADNIMMRMYFEVKKDNSPGFFVM